MELLQIFIIVAAAQAAAVVFRRLRQPVVVGEILVGILLGPSLINFVTPSSVLRVLGELGVIMLMFMVGLETPLPSIRKVGKSASLVAAGGVILPFVFGWLAVRLLGHSSLESLFVGTALVATSVGVTARVLAELGVVKRDFARIILGAAVIDDILGLLVLAVITGVAKGGFSVSHLAWVLLSIVAFFVLVLAGLPPLVRKIKPAMQQRSPSTLFLVSMVLVLGLAVLASYIELAAIVGAFLAGMVLADETHDLDLVRQVEVLGSFLTPFFFVGVGVAVELSALSNLNSFLVLLLVLAIAIFSKLIGCAAAALASGESLSDAYIIGVGMIPRGEVGIIVASIALASHAISTSIYGIVVLMSVVTTVVTPPILSVLIKRQRQVKAG